MYGMDGMDEKRVCEARRSEARQRYDFMIDYDRRFVLVGGVFL